MLITNVKTNLSKLNNDRKTNSDSQKGQKS